MIKKVSQIQKNQMIRVLRILSRAKLLRLSSFLSKKVVEKRKEKLEKSTQEIKRKDEW